MVLPRLIHPIPCVIEQIDRANTLMDPDAREPIQQAARTAAFTVPGQPKYEAAPGGPGAIANLNMDPQGPSDTAVGYVLFRVYDLENHPLGPITLQKGDRITMQGWIVEEVYIIRLQPRGHYSDQNGASLIKAWFTDRLPSKERAP